MSVPEDYKFKTSEEAELLPLPLQILRLKEINAGLCHNHNTLLIMNTRAETRITELEGALRGWLKFNEETCWISDDETGPERHALTEESQAALGHTGIGE